MAAIGGFRSDLSITHKTDGDFGNVSAGVLFSKVAWQRKRWYMSPIPSPKKNTCRNNFIARVQICLISGSFMHANGR